MAATAMRAVRSFPTPDALFRDERRSTTSRPLVVGRPLSLLPFARPAHVLLVEAVAAVHLQRARERHDAVVVAGVGRARGGKRVHADERLALQERRLGDVRQRPLPDRGLQLVDDQRPGLRGDRKAEGDVLLEVGPVVLDVPVELWIRPASTLAVAEDDHDRLAVAAAHLDRDPRGAIPAPEEVQLLRAQVGVDLAVQRGGDVHVREVDHDRGGEVLAAAGRDIAVDRVLLLLLRLVVDRSPAALAFHHLRLRTDLVGEEAKLVERLPRVLRVEGERLGVEPAARGPKERLGRVERVLLRHVGSGEDLARAREPGLVSAGMEICAKEARLDAALLPPLPLYAVGWAALDRLDHLRIETEMLR